MPYSSYARALAFGLIFAGTSAQAHEFWIDPFEYEVEEGGKIIANTRVGQMMKGEIYPYISSTFVAFTITDPDGLRPVPGDLGRRPALQVTPKRGGLHVAAYHSTASYTRYKSPEKFRSFLEKEGLAWVEAAHRERGLPEAGFREAYTRFAKSLVAVGGGAGRDTAMGLRFELIAETNPYTDSGPLTVRLVFEDGPQPDTQLAVFRRAANGNVTRDVLHTDADGRATISRVPGSEVLLSAVHMVEPSPDLAAKKGAVWHSLWASLTYADPQP